RDAQLILPTLIVQHTPIAAQIIFFGALLSAIMSCSSATLLAPSVAFSENIVKSLVPGIGDRGLLRVMRSVLIGFAALVLLFALNSDASIFKMVESAYKVTLVAAFVPLLAGLYWSRATTQGALLAIVGGLVTWLTLEGMVAPDQIWPPQLVGALVAAGGMVVGSLLPQWMTHSPALGASEQPSRPVRAESSTGPPQSH
ncbi:MAG: sodium:solute symporter, partial [Armatimonadetes bacterium]|nr:sodium:solute symporter [Armatimonadota bacterium]